MLRKLARFILNVLTTASLVLCTAVGALWVRSYRAVDSVFLYYDPLLGRRNDLAFSSDRGRLYAMQTMQSTGADHPVFFDADYDRDEGFVPWFVGATVGDRQLFGFGFGRGDPNEGTFYGARARAALGAEGGRAAAKGVKR